jgi:TRAP-type C4-dicarboxylate transport system permease small subunit
VVDRFPEKIQKTAEVIIYLISLVILLYFAVQSANLARQMYTTQRTTDILKIPYVVIYAAFPIGCVLMISNYTLTLIKNLKNREVRP